jgi:hypothetical protein
MIVYFRAKGCASCDLSGLTMILRQKGYIIRPKNKPVYEINTILKQLNGIDEIPKDTQEQIFDGTSSFAKIRSLL